MSRTYWKYQSVEARQEQILKLESWALKFVGSDMTQTGAGKFRVTNFKVGKNLNGVWFYGDGSPRPNTYRQYVEGT